MGYIYKITNNVNSKMYIGKTNNSIEERFKEHCSDYKKERCEKRPLYSAMKKYGPEAFSVELIEETDFTEDREKYWIAYYDTFKKGYNATLGGDGKQYIDYDLVVKKYNILKNAKKVASELNISIDSVYSILKNRNISIKSSQEIQLETYGKVVYMISLDDKYLKSFPSTKAAAKYMVDNKLTGCKLTTIRTHISQVCNNKRKTAAGFKWSYISKYS